MSDNFEHTVYSPEVIEFVTVAKEFCSFIEQFENFEQRELLERFRKFIPLLYLKGTLLPKVESNMDMEVQKFITEEDWNFLREGLKKKIAQYDEYSEEFEDRLHETDELQTCSLSENFADIYNMLKDFIVSYREGLVDVMNESLWELEDTFDMYWGKACVNSLRILHNILSGELTDDFLSGDSYNPNMDKSFIGQRQREWRD